MSAIDSDLNRSCGAIVWLPDNITFSVVNVAALNSKVLPMFFKKIKYTSFVRKLKRWGFKSEKKKMHGYQSFCHDLFRKGCPDLVLIIRCPRDTGKNTPKKKQTLSENVMSIIQKRSSLSSDSAYHGVNTQPPPAGLYNSNDLTELVPIPKHRHTAYLQSMSSTIVATAPPATLVRHLGTGATRLRACYGPAHHAPCSSPSEHEPHNISYMRHVRLLVEL